MLKYAVMLAVVAVAAAEELPDTYVEGGAVTTIENHPYQVSIEYLTGYHICGGVIFSEKYIITAARCLLEEEPDDYRVRIGTSRQGAAGKIYAAEWHKEHPGHLERRVDVAVIKLKEAITFGPTAQPIKLASTEPQQGEKLTITGWGNLGRLDDNISSVLQAVRLPSIDRALCALVYGEVITEATICAGVKGKDSCVGDSGGPIINDRRELVGIVAGGSECGEPGYPGVFTNIVSPIVRDFILETTKK